jgi:hypothetical protein
MCRMANDGSSVLMERYGTYLYHFSHPLVGLHVQIKSLEIAIRRICDENSQFGHPGSPGNAVHRTIGIVIKIRDCSQI